MIYEVNTYDPESRRFYPLSAERFEFPLTITFRRVELAKARIFYVHPDSGMRFRTISVREALRRIYA